MRPLAALLFAALVVLAGCSVPFIDGSGNNATTQSTAPPDNQTTATGGDTTNAPNDTTDTSAAGTETGGATPTPEQTLADPPQDVLGWEGGLWHNESVSVSAGNGLNASERDIVVNRSMARIETIRKLEFENPVPVRVISREAFQQRPGGISSRDYSVAFRTFDNVKFEAMFLVGERNDSLAVQQSNRGQNVLGFYSPRNDSIVVISPTDTPRLTRSTLSHELVHALQDQQFDLTSSIPRTREAANARNGLIEGGANYVQQRYDGRCGNEWQCIQTPQNTGGSPDIHLGVYLLSYFPYADGPGFVDYVYDREGWTGVNALYETIPTSTEQIIKPRKYDTDRPTTVTLRDTSSNGWTRVRPDIRPDYAVLGQSALSTMFAYTLYDEYNTPTDRRTGSSVVTPTEFFNLDSGGINRSNPFDYDLNYTDGWDGDRMYIYRKNNQTAYVWKITWDSPAEAREFVRGYERLLTHWGGERVLGRQGVWEIRRDSPFTDAFRITRQGDTVIIVNAPQPEDLDDVHVSG